MVGGNEGASAPAVDETTVPAGPPDTYPEVWAVGVVRWNLGADGSEWQVLSRGYDKPANKLPSDEAFVDELIIQNSGRQGFIDSLSVKKDFVTKSPVPDRDERFTAVTFYNCRPGTSASPQLTYVICCDSETKEQVTKNGQHGTGYGVVAAQRFYLEVAEAFRAAFPLEEDLTPEKCSSFNETLGEMIRKQQNQESKMDQLHELQEKSRAQHLTGMKMAEDRKDSVNEVLAKSDSL